METPFIVAVKRHSLEDGPGIRSVVFFKGCPLRCVFCQNPETQNPGVEIALYEERCSRCGRCADACPRWNTHNSDVDCRVCGRCAEVCPQGALTAIGRRYEVAELVELLLRDVAFYRHSGGGVTFSGGECTLFPDYLAAVGAQLKAHDVHLALQTCGEFSAAIFIERVLPVVDLIYFDLKLADSAEHALYTGRDNSRILANLADLARLAPGRLQVRIPLVPGVTLSDENFAGLIAQIRACGLSGATLLPYNPLGLSMAKRLGCDHPKAMHLQTQPSVSAAPGALPATLPTSFLTAAEFAEATARFERMVRRVFAGDR